MEKFKFSKRTDIERTSHIFETIDIFRENPIDTIKSINIKLSNAQYKFISEIIWGGSPIDKTWAIETKIFKNSYEDILLKYPFLDKSI